MTRVSLPVLALLASLGPAHAQSASLKLIERVESLYNDIYVYQRPDGYMTLSFGARRLNYIELIVNPTDELELPVYYTQSMTVGAAYAAELESAAMIGLGGGRTSWYLHKSIPELKFTAVELDPQVARIADSVLQREAGAEFRDRGARRPHLPRAQPEDLRHHPGRRLSRPVRPVPPAHHGILRAGHGASEPGRRGGAERRAVDHAVRQRGRHHRRGVSTNIDFFERQGNIVIVAYDGPRQKTRTTCSASPQRAPGEIQVPLRPHRASSRGATSRRGTRAASRSPTTSRRSSI